MEGSGFSEFLSQIVGLAAITLFVGVLWVASLVLIFQRAAERRRRERAGLPVQPSVLSNLEARLGLGARGTANPLASQSPSSLNSPLPSPSLSALTADIPLPDLDSLTLDFPNDLPAAEEELAALPPPPPPRPISEPLQVPQASTALNYRPGSNELPSDAVEVMRVWRDVSDGTLIVGIKDQLFATPAELQGSEMANRYRALLQELNRIQPIPRPAPKPTPEALAPLNQGGRRGVAPATPVEEAPTLGIAGEIENLLQNKLRFTGALPGREVHVRLAPDGSLAIEVDGEFYKSLDDVEDGEVQQFLRQTIQEWEASH
ncbi:MAG: hypothetical protein HC915_05965 [Anaerolineae bacterium]|nr:hypothetical protein [Anaerolineae bacterium]